MLTRIEGSYLQQKQFLADMSHELRTPLAAMATSLQVTLRKPREPEEYRSSLHACESEVRHLKRLVELVMEQVRGDLRDRSEVIENLEAISLLEECVHAARLVGVEQNITVSFIFQERKWITTEPARLRSVVMNLLFNAIEHNRAGGRVELVATSTSAGIAMRVRDNGPGIAREKIPHLFEPFFRGDQSRRGDGFQHLGLGLFIVRSHLRALGGRCTVESQIGVGSEFRLEIPGVAIPTGEASNIERESDQMPSMALSARSLT
jgi:signal transduction histidine kinase